MDEMEDFLANKIDREKEYKIGDVTVVRKVGRPKHLVVNKDESGREYSFIKCRSCNVIKQRFNAGRYPDMRSTRWVGEDGYEWNGHTCPTCHKQKVRLNSKLKALKNKIVEDNKS